jgi:hypothetical protein
MFSVIKYTNQVEKEKIKKISFYPSHLFNNLTNLVFFKKNIDYDKENQNVGDSIRQNWCG